MSSFPSAVTGLRRSWAAALKRGRRFGKLLWTLFLKFFGPPVLLIMFTLPVYGKWGEVYRVLPRVLSIPVAGRVALALLDVYLLVAGLYSTAMAAFSDPGFAPAWLDDTETLPGKERQELADPARPNSWSFAELRELCREVLATQPRRESHEETFPSRCERCRKQRWARTHHCSVCRRCVQRMDHHCVLINNCVGARNYRHFLLAVFYLWAGCLLFLSLGICAEAPSSEGAPAPQVGSSGILGDLWDIYTVGPDGLRGLEFQATVCWPCAITCYALTTYLLFFHIWMVWKNETTIESYANAKIRRAGREPKRLYDLGPRRNFQEVFGPVNPWSLRWLLPFGALPVLGDHAATA